MLNINNNPYRYISRDFSWIKFNERVLQQAYKFNSVPLLERIKFLGIASSNLDEFIMVRFGKLYNNRFSTELDLSGISLGEEYKILFEEIKKFRKKIRNTYKMLKTNLHSVRIDIVSYSILNSDDKKYIDNIFMNEIYPLLTPIAFDTTKEFPSIRSKELTMIVTLEDGNEYSKEDVMSLISLRNIPRMYPIYNNNGSVQVVLLEDIIQHNLKRLFINKKVIECGLFRIFRNAYLEVSNDRTVYLVDRMKEILTNRNISTPIMMEYSNIGKTTLDILISIMNIQSNSVIECRDEIDYSMCLDFPKINNCELYYRDFRPQFPKEFITGTDIFSVLDKQDVIVHHPYESYEPVIKFIEDAANDNNVLAIRQTLYRVSSENSPIINALCKAAKRGCRVTVLLEVKARFDEDRNISLIDKLKLSGCQIIYGLENLKTHCKLTSIIRKENDKLTTYTHIGTGNYNEKTAKLYTDISFFTSNKHIGRDTTTLFNILSGYSSPENKEITSIYFSPYNLRLKLDELIDKERRKGKDGKIILKLNSLSDKDMIDKLYKALDKGVDITIICRGSCSISRRRKDGSKYKNLTIKSIIGRYLEHSRIYVFGKDKDTKVFIASADMLTRNLDRRIELLTPIIDENCKNKLLEILNILIIDNINSFIVNQNDEYIKEDIDSMIINSHKIFMDKAISDYKLRSIPIYKKKRK